MLKKAIVFLADGLEEVEAITPIDYLRRAGVEVTTVSIGSGEQVMGSHKIPIAADTTLEKLHVQGKDAAADWDAVVLPGGGVGSENLAASPGVGGFLKEMAGAGKLVCAICAAPAVVLAPLGLLQGRRFTCYPGMEDRVRGAQWSGDRVVIDGLFITSRGAGTAGEFARGIIGKLVGQAEADKLAESVLL
ncbi:protein ThiJ [Treponema primitia ZAS-2]|uniref:Protein ThiJ n=1 Tax=Treponema primitia (strain ATCC BAA-887 / DSM 12427 / ZAS-2) TaxID=545694 RepID=F5YQH2_TREPZ|nr:DJ-1 family glyoxalase III [Treponema primitia]AEF86959.1 protein ThiJ [Treponema primitia ZAS-2]